jgi:hypothetical protein
MLQITHIKKKEIRYCKYILKKIIIVLLFLLFCFDTI